MKIISRAILLSLIASFPASAALVLSYQGQEGSGISANTITGTGFIEFDRNLGMVSLSDVTDFSLTNTFTIRNGTGDVVDVYEWNYGFVDLIAFSTTFLGDQVATLQLRTAFLEEASGKSNVKPANFIVDAFPAARTEAQDGNFSFTVTQGTVSAVPEPSSLFFAAIGALLGVLRQRKRI